jgi:hypothetical protein
MPVLHVWEASLVQENDLGISFENTDNCYTLNSALVCIR